MNALQLAAALEVSDKHPELINVNNRAAAELRRLHEVNKELLEALQGLVDLAHQAGFPCDKAEAALAKATGEQA